MAKLPKPHKHHTGWTDKDKLRVAVVYKSLGNQAKTCEITGVPPRTLAFWMQQDWWKEQLLSLRAEDSLELEEAATTIAKKSNEVVHERLTNGDFVLNRDGELIRKPVSARDAAVIGAIAIDKRKVLQEEPQREQQLGTAERLLKLVEQFTRFTNAREIKGMLNETQKADQKPTETEFTEVPEAAAPIGFFSIVPEEEKLKTDA